jgi:perosamine synthetase
MKWIPQVEPYITQNDINAITRYLNSGGWLTEFEKTEEFERMIADFLGVKYAVVVTSGTVALYLSLLALDIGSGDSVVVPDYTMIASPNSVRWAGTEVILSDVERGTLCLDLDKVVLKKNTKAMMYVPINGRSGDMDRVRRFCKDNDLLLIEDACQAFGSKWNDKYLGTFGEIGVFSFTPHKIITTGQGGAVVTNNEEISEKVRKLKDFHRIKPGVDIHTGIGFNFKFTDLQSVIGIEQLKIIDYRIRRKREIYRAYMDALSGIDYIEMLPIDLTQVVPWFVDVILKIPRDRVISRLKENGIGSRSFYPAVHSQAPYKNIKGDLSVSSGMAPRGLWLPSSIALTAEEIERVAGTLSKL